MFNVLLLEDEPELQDRIAFLLESVTGVILERAYDRKQAAEILQAREGKVDLLIIDSNHRSISALGDLKDLAAHIDTIFCVQNANDAPPAYSGWKIFSVIERHFIASLLLVSLQKWKAGKLQDAAPVEQRKYCRIKTKLLLDVNPLNVDIYARLSESKYIKVLQKNDTFDNADLDKYDQQKKIEYMYLLTDDIGNFIQKYIAYIEEVVRQKKNISIDELAEMNGSIYESVRELTEKIGFTQEVAALAKSQVRLTVKTMGKKPVLKNILYQIEGKSGQYLGDHSLLTGFLACGIAAQMEWNSESTFHKLMLASFMHDISISDNRIAECESIADAEALHLSANEMAAFQKHPFRIAEFIRKMSDIPPDVDSIVMQHHELPGGEGFPRGLTSSYIAPLSGIFIVAHHMAKEVLKDRERFDLRQYLQRMHQKWPQALFKRILISASGLAL